MFQARAGRFPSSRRWRAERNRDRERYAPAGFRSGGSSYVYSVKIGGDVGMASIAREDVRHRQGPGDRQVRIIMANAALGIRSVISGVTILLWRGEGFSQLDKHWRVVRCRDG